MLTNSGVHALTGMPCNQLASFPLRDRLLRFARVISLSLTRLHFRQLEITMLDWLGLERLSSSTKYLTEGTPYVY
jgi:hypothetical protein